MLHKVQYSVIVLTISIIFLFANEAMPDTKSAALLQGVAKQRLKYDCFSLTIVTEYKNDVFYGDLRIKSHFDIDDNKRFLKQFPSENNPKLFPGNLSMLLNQEIYDYKIGRTDVTLCDINIGRSRGIVIYDPRILGLTVRTDLGADVNEVLCIGDAEHNGTAVVEKKGGKDLWHIHYYNIRYKDVTYDYWIEEPTFRVYHVVKKSTNPDLISIIDLEYLDAKFEPFPSKVHLIRDEQGKRVFDRTITVLEFEVKKSFSPETFSLKFLELPLNTSVTDYRINKILGYWDGEKLSIPPVNTREPTEIKQATFEYWRITLMVMGIAVMIFAVILTIYKRRT
jgi:hypothetical protein